MDGITRNIKIHGVFIKKGAIEGIASGKDPAADGIGTCQDDDFGMGYCIIAYLQGPGHILCDGSGDHYSVGMAGRGHKFNSKPSHVEIHIAGCIQFPFTAVVTAGRYLA